MQNYNQNNPEWKNKQHGSSSSTIGKTGCTITGLGDLGDLNPFEVNKRLNDIGGYAAPKEYPTQKNLVVWSKIKEAIPWLEFEWRGYTYNSVNDNNMVKIAIQKYGGCLVEVDAKPIGGTRHWVVYRGNQKLYDPFDGKEKPTSTYSAVGFSIIRVLPKPVDNPLKMVVAQVMAIGNSPTTDVDKISQWKQVLATV